MNAADGIYNNVHFIHRRGVGKGMAECTYMPYHTFEYTYNTYTHNKTSPFFIIIFLL